MDPIQAARELGKAIQADSRYKRLRAAQQNNDSDQELQEDIGVFNMMRSELSAEIQKEDKDSAAIREMDKELKQMYSRIFANENMAEFTEARSDLQEMIAFVNQIITGSANGQNPETIEFQLDCTSDCNTCAGC